MNPADLKEAADFISALTSSSFYGHITQAEVVLASGCIVTIAGDGTSNTSYHVAEIKAGRG